MCTQRHIHTYTCNLDVEHKTNTYIQTYTCLERIIDNNVPIRIEFVRSWGLHASVSRHVQRTRTRVCVRVCAYTLICVCTCFCVCVSLSLSLSLSPPSPLCLSVSLSVCVRACCVCVWVVGRVGGLQHLMKFELGLTPVVIVTMSTAAIILPLAVVNDCGLEYDNVSSTWCVLCGLRKLCECVSDCVCSSRAPAHVRLLFVPTAYYACRAGKTSLRLLEYFTKNYY